MQARATDAAGRDLGASAAEPAGDRRPDRHAADACRPGVPVHAERLGRLAASDQFEDIIVKTGTNGDVTRVRDVAPGRTRRPDLQRYFRSTASQRSASACSSRPAPTRSRSSEPCRRRWRRWRKPFRRACKYDIPFDTTKFVRNRLTKSTRRLSRPALLVLVVILIFLQDWRAMLVPATTVPVTIIGAFAFMAALGFTINISTCSPSCSRSASWWTTPSSSSKAPRTTSRRACLATTPPSRRWTKLFGPIIGITLVLMAVFLPTAFLPG